MNLLLDVGEFALQVLTTLSLLQKSRVLGLRGTLLIHNEFQIREVLEIKSDDQIASDQFGTENTYAV